MVTNDSLVVTLQKDGGTRPFVRQLLQQRGATENNLHDNAKGRKQKKLCYQHTRFRETNHESSKVYSTVFSMYCLSQQRRLPILVIMS